MAQRIPTLITIGAEAVDHSSLRERSHIGAGLVESFEGPCKFFGADKLFAVETSETCLTHLEETLEGRLGDCFKKRCNKVGINKSGRWEARALFSLCEKEVAVMYSSREKAGLEPCEGCL
jgi:hypothetical protein